VKIRKRVTRFPGNVSLVKGLGASTDTGNTRYERPSRDYTYGLLHRYNQKDVSVVAKEGQNIRQDSKLCQWHRG